MRVNLCFLRLLGVDIDRRNAWLKRAKRAGVLQYYCQSPAREVPARPATGRQTRKQSFKPASN